MGRRSVYRTILSATVLLLTLIAPAAVAARTTPNMTTQVKELIETYGPLLVIHPQEQYLLDKPEAVLDGPSTLNWGLVYNEENPLTFHRVLLGSIETSASTILQDEALAQQDPHASDPNFRIWLESDASLLSGHLPRAKSYIMVSNPNGDENTLDIQFWFYYAYNGPAKAQVSISVPGVGEVANEAVSLESVGRHQGDWEQVILRFTRSNSGADWSLESLFLSQHSGGEWLPADQFSYDGSHPIVYSALDSHANYATTGQHQNDETIVDTTIQIPGVPFPVDVTANQLDYTAIGQTFTAYRPGNFDIVSSTVSGVKTATSPQWFGYDGLWGPYQVDGELVSVNVPALGGEISYPFAQVDKGPIGPAQH